jgi:Fe-S-cluster-containing dehydrogenase component
MYDTSNGFIVAPEFLPVQCAYCRRLQCCMLCPYQAVFPSLRGLCVMQASSRSEVACQ